jgi:hypothetical protein
MALAFGQDQGLPSGSEGVWDMLDGVRLGEKSPAALAVTSWRDQLYLAWTGSDLHINLASSPDGREITGKQRLAQQSYAQVMVGSYQARVSQKQAMGPSLAASGERLYLAWTDGDSAVNVVAVEEPVRAAPVTLDERSGCPPSLTAADNGNLVLAWAGSDRDGHVNLLTLAADSSGTPVPLTAAKTRFEEARSNTAPTVCSHQGGLVLAWRGTDRHINVLATAGDPYGAPVKLEEAKSDSAPALCSHQGSLVLAWTGTDHHINVLATAGDPYGAPVKLEEAKSGCAPALCSHQGSLIVAWSGTDHHINVARLR